MRSFNSLSCRLQSSASLCTVTRNRDCVRAQSLRALDLASSRTISFRWRTHCPLPWRPNDLQCNAKNMRSIVKRFLDCVPQCWTHQMFMRHYKLPRFTDLVCILESASKICSLWCKPYDISNGNAYSFHSLFLYTTVQFSAPKSCRFPSICVTDTAEKMMRVDKGQSRRTKWNRSCQKILRPVILFK